MTNDSLKLAEIAAQKNEFAKIVANVTARNKNMSAEEVGATINAALRKARHDMKKA